MVQWTICLSGLPLRYWQKKNSSIGTAESKPDHFGTRETNDRSWWTVGGPPDKRSFIRRISALDSSNSARNRASAIPNFEVRTDYIPNRSGFNSRLVPSQIFFL